MTGDPRVWGDVREDGKNELVWEFENWTVSDRLAVDPKK